VHAHKNHPKRVPISHHFKKSITGGNKSTLIRIVYRYAPKHQKQYQMKSMISEVYGRMCSVPGKKAQGHEYNYDSIHGSAPVCKEDFSQGRQLQAQ
jgi:hypothetical protein